jgi:hypothetical protein
VYGRRMTPFPSEQKGSVNQMQGLVAKLMDLLAMYPGATVAAVIAAGFAVLVWGVVSTSYRYR